MDPAAAESSRSWHPDRHGRLVLGLVVALAVAASFFQYDGPLRVDFVLPVLALSLLFVVIALLSWDRLERATLAQRALYFAVQLAVVGGVMALFAQQRTFGISWLLLMPLAGQSLAALPRWGTALVCLLGTALVIGHVYVLAGWRALPEPLFGYLAALVFVLLFTGLAVREQRARKESERLGAELTDANTLLACYAMEAEELAASRERNRMAREIHDSVGHSLTVVSVQLEAARTVFEHDRAQAKRAVETALRLTRQGLDEIRSSVRALRAAPLERQPLTEVLQQLTRETERSGLDGSFDLLGDPRELSPEASQALYRAAQEALTNVHKHAEATLVEVTLDYRNPASVRLVVADNGRGTRNTAGGYGLLGLRERLSLLDGRLELRSNLGAGLTLEVEVPS